LAETQELDLKDLIGFVTRALVDHPEQVEVNSVEGDRTTVFELRVAPEDLGQIIGKQGRTIRAVRTILAAATTRSDQRAVLEVLE
jgi:predicted RNA-binding protein YlqC (UPF0109 family)